MIRHFVQNSAFCIFGKFQSKQINRYSFLTVLKGRGRFWLNSQKAIATHSSAYSMPYSLAIGLPNYQLTLGIAVSRTQGE